MPVRLDQERTPGWGARLALNLAGNLLEPPITCEAGATLLVPIRSTDCRPECLQAADAADAWTVP